MSAPARKWDTHEIKAQLNRQGWTLTRLALENGLPENACRRALNSSNLAGALVIAKTLGVTVQELFPGRYLRRQGNPATASTEKSSLKCAAGADRGAAA